MTLRWELALTAVCVFGYLHATTPDSLLRWGALAVAVNGVLCHVGGLVDWDVACNAAMWVFVQMTSRDQPRDVLWCGAPVLVWAINHTGPQRRWVHALGVQLLGAHSLARWSAARSARARPRAKSSTP